MWLYVAEFLAAESWCSAWHSSGAFTVAPRRGEAALSTFGLEGGTARFLAQGKHFWQLPLMSLSLDVVLA